MTTGPRPFRVGILFTQFGPYHVDRCRAIGARLGGRAEVIAVEVATMSTAYAWEPSGHVDGVRKRVLFPGRTFERIPVWRRFWAELRALRDCDVVFIGIGYNEPDVIALGFALRAIGCRAYVMTDSKFEDLPRRVDRELVKALVLTPYRGAIVAGSRQRQYLRFLGFHRRPLLEGFDVVDVERMRIRGGGELAPEGRAYGDRDFVFVGRFVEHKNLDMLLDAYAQYRASEGDRARPLTLVGGGELEVQVRARIESLGLGDAVTITGFVGIDEVAHRLRCALALLLPSRQETWGLVVNEALAFHLPVVVSEEVGARDALVRSQVNGYIVESDSPSGWVAAMTTLGTDEALWRRMVAASASMADRGDVHRFADAVESLAFPV